TVIPDTVDLTEDGQTITITATNPYRDHRGKLAIEKIETGDTAPGNSYSFEIRDTDNTVVDTLTVTAGTTAETGWLPLGTYTITELEAPDGATVIPDTVDLTEDGQTITITATNPYRDHRGKLAIEKIVSGDPDADGVYTMNVTGPKSFTVTVKAGDTWTSDWLPLGSYTVTEVDAPIGATIVPSPAVLRVDGATVTVVVTNPTLQSAGVLPATGGGLGVLPWISVALVAAGSGLLLVVRAGRTRC
uniref:prealbumin-like fold domain-containing protein n=1 Tax=Ilumatobacter sp. TaxID=1967498 RepID=UPI002611FF24